MRWSVAIVLIVLPAHGRDRIWDIEFFGYKGIDIEAVRKAISVHEGDEYAGDETKKKVREAVSDAVGRDATDVQGICCDENGDRVLFIGLPGSSNKSFSYNPEPTGTARLSDEITTLQDRLNQALEAAASFIDLINSGIWSDRNKGSFVLLELTRTRDPNLLTALRAKALDSLIEMARWRSMGHALPARVVLGRIAGLPEEGLLQLATGPPEPILDALPRQ
jgi:hypothetical protein